STSSWVAGLNLWTDQFEQRQGYLADPLNYSLTTVGIFVQNIWNVSDPWTLETGFRLDHLNTEGFFPLPKISAMYKPNPALTMRIGGGLGYRSPTVFTENTERIQFQNVIPIHYETLVSERSAGANLDINYRLALGEDLSLAANTLFFFTQIQNPLILERSANGFEFIQPDGKFETR